MRKVVTWAAAMCFVVAVWSVFAHPWGWLFAIGVHPYPAPQTPWTYQLLSGFLPALTVVTLLSLVAGAWRHVNCHQPGCPRFGRHKVSGTPWCDIHVENARPERTDQEILISIEDKLSVLIDVLQDRA